MRAQPFARVVRPVGRILFLADAAPDDYCWLDNPDTAPDGASRTAAYLYRALQATGAAVLPTNRPEDILDLKDFIDFVFSARSAYAYPSVDVPVATLCELAGVPCLNGNTFAVAMARDKQLCKLAAQRAGLDTPDWIIIHPTDNLDRLESLPYPCCIKWLTGGNSYDVAGDGMAGSAEEAKAIVRQWQRAGHTVMVEDFAPGTDLVVGVIDRGAKGPTIGRAVQVDTDHRDNIQTFAHKMMGQGKRQRSLVGDQEVQRRVEDAVRRLHEVLKPLDCYRVDFRWNAADQDLQFLEVNPTVSIEPESIFIQSLGGSPADHSRIIRAVLDAALARHALRLPASGTLASVGPASNSTATTDDMRPLGRLLFLGQFAPRGPKEPPAPYDEKWGSISRVHHQLYRTLLDLGLDVISSRDPADIMRLAGQVDFVFSVFEGEDFPSTGMIVPALCEAAGLPFLGAPARSLAPDIDKQLGKMLAAHLGMATPNWIRVGASVPARGLDSLTFPCIVKWQHGGNSRHLTADAVVADEKDAALKIADLQRQGLPVLVEEFVSGTNLTVAAVQFPDGLRIGDTVRIDTDAPGNIQTYDQKMFDSGERRKSIFTQEAVLERIDEFMRRLYVEIAPADCFRADFRYNDETGALFFLEANLQCNLDPFGSFCLSAVGGPERYPHLIKSILSASARRQGLVMPDTAGQQAP